MPPLLYAICKKFYWCPRSSTFQSLAIRRKAFSIQGLPRFAGSTATLVSPMYPIWGVDVSDFVKSDTRLQALS